MSLDNCGDEEAVHFHIASSASASASIQGCDQTKNNGLLKAFFVFHIFPLVDGISSPENGGQPVNIHEWTSRLLTQES